MEFHSTPISAIPFPLHSTPLCSIPLSPILLHSAPFHSISTPLHFASFHSTPIHFTPIDSTPLLLSHRHTTLHNSTPLHSVPWYSISTPFHSIPLHFTQLHSSPLYSISFYSTPLHFNPVHFTPCFEQCYKHISTGFLLLFYCCLTFSNVCSGSMSEMNFSNLAMPEENWSFRLCEQGRRLSANLSTQSEQSYCLATTIPLCDGP